MHLALACVVSPCASTEAQVCLSYRLVFANSGTCECASYVGQSTSIDMLGRTREYIQERTCMDLRTCILSCLHMKDNP